MRIGTVDLPPRVEKERYFEELSYLELSSLFAGPQKPSALAKWAEVALDGTIGLVAPWVLTQRTPPTLTAKTTRTWNHDATVGDFRDSVHARSALVQLRAAVEQLHAACVVFKSPALFAPSAANRDRLREFFGNIATHETVGSVPRVWIPDGLWEPRTAVAFATELGVTCAIDPLVVDPLSPYALDDLGVESIYFRVEGLGRAGSLRTEDLEDLVDIAANYEDVTIAFASQSRWNDARNLRKTLET
ncbi:MAG: hypothetical protein NT062_09235 [Proteobacteria bacterium]|nr:hypothetical protein [Pseudomonadota bacterium]